MFPVGLVLLNYETVSSGIGPAGLGNCPIVAFYLVIGAFFTHINVICQSEAGKGSRIRERKTVKVNRVGKMSKFDNLYFHQKFYMLI